MASFLANFVALNGFTFSEHGNVKRAVGVGVKMCANTRANLVDGGRPQLPGTVAPSCCTLKWWASVRMVCAGTSHSTPKVQEGAAWAPFWGCLKPRHAPR